MVVANLAQIFLAGTTLILVCLFIERREPFDSFARHMSLFLMPIVLTAPAWCIFGLNPLLSILLALCGLAAGIRLRMHPYFTPAELNDNHIHTYRGEDT